MNRPMLSVALGLLSAAYLPGLCQSQTNGRQPTIPLNRGSQNASEAHMYFPEDETPWFAAEGIGKELNFKYDEIQRLTEIYGSTRQRLRSLNSDKSRENSRSVDKAKDQWVSEYGDRFDLEFARGSRAVFKDPQQRERFNQLYLQYQGFGAFDRPQVQRKLNFSEQQIRQVQDLNREWNSEIHALRQSYLQNPPDARNRFSDIHDRFRMKLDGILNSEQQEIYRNMTGKPYPFGVDAYLGDVAGRR